MKLKKICVLFIIFIIIFQVIVFADDELEENIIWKNEEIILNEKDNEVNEIKVLSKHCICIERTTEQVLFEKDAYTRCAMASTTKILTGIIVIENCSLSDEVEISKKATGIGGSTLGIKTGDKITVESLLYGLLLRSGNDTAVALAEYVGGSIENFSNIMNKKAKEIGLKNSNFITPHGLDNDEHYTTAYDLAILTNYALKNEIFCKIVGTKKITINIGKSKRELNNTNELLGLIDGVYGVKTGFTGNAGRCLVTACKRNDLDVIVIVLGADTKKTRGDDSKKIIKYVFQTFKMIDIKKEIEEVFNTFKNTQKIKSIKSLNEIRINYNRRKDYLCPIDKNKINKIRSSIYCLKEIEAPVNKNTIIGKMRLICDKKILYEIDIILDKKIEKIDWKNYMKKFVKNYITFYKI